MTTPEPGETSRTAGLPLQLTRFVGRDRELEDLSRLLPATRLLTLTGVGGKRQDPVGVRGGRANGWSLRDHRVG